MEEGPVARLSRVSAAPIREAQAAPLSAGHYTYVDIAVLTVGRTVARLVSEPLPATTGSCLHFYYNMNFFGHSCE